MQIKPFQMSRIAVGVLLATNLSLPGIGMAADASPLSPPSIIHGGSYVVTNEAGETVVIEVDVPEELLQKLRDDWASTLERIELISNAPPKQYTLEELAQMVGDDSWTPEGLKRIVAVELPNGDGPVQVNLPPDAQGDTVLTPEQRIRSVLPPIELLDTDGSLRVRVWLTNLVVHLDDDIRPLIGDAQAQLDGGSARAPVWTEELGEVNLDQYTREELDRMVRDYWTAERIRTTIPVDITWNAPDIVNSALPLAK